MGEFGAISTDVALARANLDNNEQHNGQSWRLLYSKQFESTDTNLTLANYRYSTSGYYTFADANQKYDASDINWSYHYNKRSRI